MSGHNPAVPAMTSNTGSGCHLECGEDAQMWWQSHWPAPSEANSSEHRSHLRVCPTTPDYAYERGDARMSASPPAETATTPHGSPVSDIDGHAAHHVRHGKQPMHAPPSPLLHPAPARDTLIDGGVAWLMSFQKYLEVLDFEAQLAAAPPRSG